MTIGIDARLWGLQHAGIGRYVQNVVLHLLETEADHHYILFGPQEIERDIPRNLQDRYSLVITKIPHYSLLEQIKLPLLLRQHRVDLVHFPHFNVPLAYAKPFVVTIHDILWHQVRGGNVTTLSGWKYALKYQGYKRVVAHAANASKKIIVPSNWVKTQLLQEFNNLEESKIQVIYEGVDHEQMKDERLKIKDFSKFKVQSSKFFLYVGSCYPHKNVETLIKAMAALKEKGRAEKLVLVSSRNIFRKRLESLVASLNLQDTVIFAGKLSDQELAALYPKAIALVHPSLSEGFGLTGLEAMKRGCLVIASQKGSLPEIYDKAAVYIDDPLDANLLAHTMHATTESNPLWSELREKGKALAGSYRWQKTAKETETVYNSLV